MTNSTKQDKDTPTNTLEEILEELLFGGHDDEHKAVLEAKQQIESLISQAVNKARSSELRMIETAQQDYDKWSGFCMDDTSDFGNYIEQRIKELETPNQVEGVEDVSY